MQNHSTAQVSFCEAYADAVRAYLETHQPQEVYFDCDAGIFRIAALDPHTAPDDVGLYVGNLWTEMVGPAVSGAAGSTSPGPLKSMIVQALLDSPQATYWRQVLIEGMGA